MKWGCILCFDGMGPDYSARGFSGLGLLHQREQVLINLLGRARKARVNRSLWGELHFLIVSILPGLSSRVYVSMYISLVKAVKVFLAVKRGGL
jgi:hypothetical protein